jgi:hypothetical protein
MKYELLTIWETKSKIGSDFIGASREFFGHKIFQKKIDLKVKIGGLRGKEVQFLTSNRFLINVYSAPIQSVPILDFRNFLFQIVPIFWHKNA